MMASLVALLSAVAYGAADFLGGIAARRATTIAAVIVSQAGGVLILLVVLPLLPAATVSTTDIAWGAAAGLFGGTGVALLYRALAIGPMSVVAPLTAVCAAAIPVAVGLTLGDALSPMTAAGMLLAAIAIVLLGQERRLDDHAATAGGISANGIRAALAAGAAVGLFFVSLAQTSPEAGIWPLVPARIVSVGLFSAIAAVTRQPLLVPRPVMGVAIGGGALDMLANALYLVALQGGQLSVVATLASLYPASTVVLARVVLDERLSRLQSIGIAGSVVATLLIVGGTG